MLTGGATPSKTESSKKPRLLRNTAQPARSFEIPPLPRGRGGIFHIGQSWARSIVGFIKAAAAAGSRDLLMGDRPLSGNRLSIEPNRHILPLRLIGSFKGAECHEYQKFIYDRRPRRTRRAPGGDLPPLSAAACRPRAEVSTWTPFTPASLLRKRTVCPSKARSSSAEGSRSPKPLCFRTGASPAKTQSVPPLQS